MRLKTVLQTRKSDCGIACLECILSYYQNNVPKEYLYQKTFFDGNGTTMYGLKQALDGLGFETEAKKGNLEDEKPLVFPFIAHLNLEKEKKNSHYVVVSSYQEKEVRVMDPACGKKKIEKKQFLDMASGYYLFVRPTSSCKQIVLEKRIERDIKAYFKNHKLFFQFFFILSFFCFSFELLSLFELKVFVNQAILPRRMENVFVCFSFFFLLLLLKEVSSYLLLIYQARSNYELNLQLKNKVLRHIITLPFLYYKTTEKGKFISLLQDIEFLSSFLSFSLPSLLRSIFLFSFLTIYFFLVSKTFFLPLLCSNLVFLLFVFLEKKGLNSDLVQTKKAQDVFHNQVLLLFPYVDVLKGNHLETIFIKRLRNINKKVSQSTYQLEKRRAKEKNILSFLEQGMYLVLFSFLSYLFINEKIKSFATFLLLEGFLVSILKEEENFMLFLLSYKEYKNAKKRLDELFYVKKELLLPNKDFLPPSSYTLQFHNVSYDYGLRCVLKNITLTIEEGKHIFFYGQSGSGKSTFFQLIGRYLEPKYGEISLGGRDITHYNLDQLRKIVTYVSLDVLVESGSIKDNITLKEERKDISLEKIVWISGLDQVLKRKKQSLYTFVSEEGNNYSSGEKARIALARALYKDSKIYLFDECFSSLDMKSERTILKRLFQEYKGKTILYISHRLTSKDLFDKVYYVKKGEMYEKK